MEVGVSRFAGCSPGDHHQGQQMVLTRLRGPCTWSLRPFDQRAIAIGASQHCVAQPVVEGLGLRVNPPPSSHETGQVAVRLPAAENQHAFMAQGPQHAADGEMGLGI